MKKFSEYAKESKSNTTAGSSSMADNAAAFDLLKSVASRYEGASEGDLISAILNEAKKARDEGRLSDKEIENFVYTISPMLNGAQRKQLEKVVKQIKNS